MGGRLDASNAVDADCALVVSIDLDHREWLGDDREAIGREKAGIMRRGKPAVIADRDPPSSVVAYAAAEGALPRMIGRDFDFRRVPGGWRRADRRYARAAAAAVRRRRAARQRGRLRRRRR